MRIFIKIKNHGIKIVVESEENSETVATSGGVVEKEDTSYVYESIADRRKAAVRTNSSSEEGTKKSVRWLEHRKSDHKVSDEQQEGGEAAPERGHVNDDMEINYRSNINDKHRNNHVKHHHSKSSSPTTSHHRNMNLLLCFRVRSNPDNTDNYTNTSNRALIGNKYHPSEHQNQTAIVVENSYQLSSSANSSSHKVKPENEENDANEKLIDVAEETVGGEENSRSGDHSSTLLRSTFWRLITLLNRRSSPSSSSSPSPNNQEQQRNMMKNRHRHRHNHHNNNLNCCW